MRLLLGGGFSSIGTQMARQARAFDPEVSIADVLQASRNAWTACGLEMLLGRSMCLTPSIFAYSMLYPYTDNYLDDPDVPVADKKRLQRPLQAAAGGRGERGGQRARGAHLAACRADRGAVLAGRSIPQVFESLLLIQRAQEESLGLLRRAARERKSMCCG